MCQQCTQNIPSCRTADRVCCPVNVTEGASVSPCGLVELFMSCMSSSGHTNAPLKAAIHLHKHMGNFNTWMHRYNKYFFFPNDFSI